MQSFKILTVADIPIELHITFIVLLIIIYYFWGLGGLILYIFLFASVVIHELGHSIVAKRYGVKIEKILLLPIGGVALMDKIPEKGEFKIAIAGPLVSFTLGILFLILSSIIDFNTVSIDNGNYGLFQTVGVLNILLGAFNLLPAFPMDGGRVLRALLSKKLGYLKATKIASTLGQFFAILMLIYGIITFNIILTLIAVFIYLGAYNEYHNLLNERIFSHINVKDIMTTNIVSVSPENSINDLLNLMFKYRYLGYPVVDKKGYLIGTVSLSDISDIGENIQVKDIMKKPITISEDCNFKELLDKIDKDDRVYITDKSGKLKGLISKTDIIRLLKIESLLNK